MQSQGVIVIAPAWHSCGSYQVFKRQMVCLRDLNLRSYFLAVAPTGTIQRPYWQSYDQATHDLPADERGCAMLSRNLLKHRELWTEVLPGCLRSVSFLRSWHTRLMSPPSSLLAFIANHKINAIICHHYFNLPLAIKIKQLFPKIQVVFESHDLQSFHHDEQSMCHPITRRKSDLAEMLKDEIAIASSADVFIHYNLEEKAAYERFLPDRPHTCIFPAAPRNFQQKKSSRSLETFDFLIVASDNEPNYSSLCWFLDNVWCQQMNERFRLRIAGNVDRLFAARRSPFLNKYGNIFLGRIENLSEIYLAARYVLLPVVQGHGIAIKTIEALSYGKRILATRLAFRGFEDLIPAAIKPEIANDASSFRQKLLDCNVQDDPSFDPRTIELYEALFSPEAQLQAYKSILDRPAPQRDEDADRAGARAPVS